MKIPFHLFLGLAQNCLPAFVQRQGVSVVVCDFSPLRFPLGWVKSTANELDKRDIPLIQVIIQLKYMLFDICIIKIFIRDDVCELYCCCSSNNIYI